MGLEFGYFLNHNNLGSTKPFRQVMEEGREIACHCDRAGWDSIWTTEHHFGHEGLEHGGSLCRNTVDVDLNEGRIRP